MKKKVLAITLSLFSLTAAAQEVDRIYETGKIVRIVPGGDHFVSIWLDGPNETTFCSGGARWTINKPSDEQSEEKYSLILAAATTGQTVRFMHLESEGCSNWDSNRIYHVDVRFDGSLD